MQDQPSQLGAQRPKKHKGKRPAEPVDPPSGKGKRKRPAEPADPPKNKGKKGDTQKGKKGDFEKGKSKKGYLKGSAEKGRPGTSTTARARARSGAARVQECFFLKKGSS